MRGLEEAFGDLQEMFGGFIAEVANKTGVIETLTTALRRAAELSDSEQLHFEWWRLGARADDLQAVAGHRRRQQLTP